jgi:hypothetical protein
LQFTSANDASERDPLTFTVFGSNGPSDWSSAAWTQIGQGNTGLGTARRVEAAAVGFANTTAYKHYKVVMTSLRNNATATSMQVADIKLGSNGSTIAAGLGQNGIAWTDVTRGALNNGDWLSVSADASGLRWVASTTGGQIFYADTSAANWRWAAAGTLAQGTRVAMSADGKALVATAPGNSGGVWISCGGNDATFCVLVALTRCEQATAQYLAEVCLTLFDVNSASVLAVGASRAERERVKAQFWVLDALLLGVTKSHLDCLYGQSRGNVSLGNLLGFTVGIACHALANSGDLTFGEVTELVEGVIEGNSELETTGCGTRYPASLNWVGGTPLVSTGNHSGLRLVLAGLSGCTSAGALLVTGLELKKAFALAGKA